MSSAQTRQASSCELCGLPVLGRPVRDGGHEYCCEGCRRVDTVARAAGLELGAADSRGRAAAASARKAAAASASGARRETYRVDGMWCASCSLILVEALMALPGVLDAEISYSASLARVIRDPGLVSREQVLERFEMLGYRATPASDVTGGAVDTGDLFLRLFVAGVVGMWVMWPTLFLVWPVAFESGWIATRTVAAFTGALSLVVLLFSGWPFLVGAWRAARVGRATMDTLVVLGTWTAWLYSAWAVAVGGGQVFFDSAAMITGIVLLGRWIEALGSRSAEEVARALTLGHEAEAWLVQRAEDHGGADAGATAAGGAVEENAGDEGVTRVAAESLAAGDLIAIRAGERVPADAEVTEGRSELDRSRLSGESLPVSCEPGDQIWAGTLNLGDTIVARVVRTGDETLAGRLSAIVEDAVFAKSHTQRLADAISAFFVPGVMSLAVMTVLGAVASGSTGGEAVSRAIAVLVVACPCALALATPLAVSNAMAAANRHGAVLRGGPVLERVGNIATIAMDKTGTLTRGKLALADVWSEPGVAADTDDVLALAAQIERDDPHPVARAIVQAAEALADARTRTAGGAPALAAATSAAPLIASSMRVPGMGRVATTEDGSKLLLGNERLMAEHGVKIPEGLRRDAEKRQANGYLVVWWHDGARTGALSFFDAPRPEAAEALARLQSTGAAIALVSGDARATCASVAEQLGIQEVHAEVLPHEKEAVVRLLAERGPVAFVGDGLNDAAALAAADLSIAIGDGADAAVVGADAVLLGGKGSEPSIASLAAILEIARSTARVVRENLAWAFTYNVVALPLAVTGRLTPVWAAAAMAGSSVAVVANSLRLRRAGGRVH